MKKTRIIAIALLVLFAALFVFKGLLDTPTKKNNNGQPTSNDKPVVQAPEFSADSAFAFVKKQVDFGPRVPNSKPAKACGDWLAAKLKSYGANVIVQEGEVTAYNDTKLNMRNIIGEFNPGAKKRVLLSAHWDTRPYADKDSTESEWKKAIDGANDGASGVGVLLELARMIQASSPTIGVDIAFWDTEDYGKPEWVKEESQDDYMTWCLGTQYWQTHPHRPGYQAMYGILLDMVGSPNARFNKEGISVEVAEDVVNRIWKTAADLGYGEYFQNQVSGEIVDDHLFLNRGGVRCIDIIDMRPSTKSMGFNGYEFGSFHHTHNDNIKNIDPKTLKAVGQTIAQVIYNSH
jgi:Peptidase family M28